MNEILREFLCFRGGAAEVSIVVGSNRGRPQKKRNLN
jgi:hypothetical protein